jgi:hypothetical protein
MDELMEVDLAASTSTNVPSTSTNVPRNCIQVTWDEWNDWSPGNKIHYLHEENKEGKGKGKEGKGKEKEEKEENDDEECEKDECEEDEEDAGKGSKKSAKCGEKVVNCGNGEEKLSQELLGNPTPNGPNDVIDIRDNRPEHNFGNISVKEFSNACKDVRLGVKVTSKYTRYIGVWLLSLQSWLGAWYYSYEEGKPLSMNFNTRNILNILTAGDKVPNIGLIEKIRKNLYDLQKYKSGQPKFRLNLEILSGAVCGIAKLPAFKKLTIDVQELINIYTPDIKIALQNMKIRLDYPVPLEDIDLSDISIYDNLKPGDFNSSTPRHITSLEFLHLFRATQMYPSEAETDTKKGVSYLDRMVRMEANGGKLLHEAIVENREAEYKRPKDKDDPVLIYVHETAGFFPVGKLAYEEIICDRISANAPKLGVSKGGRIRDIPIPIEGQSSKKAGKSPAAGQKHQIAKSPAKSSKSPSAGPAKKKAKLSNTKNQAS